MSSNYTISPFVGLIPWPYNFKVDGHETESIIEVPIPALMDKDCLRQETQIIDGNPHIIYFYHYQETVIWGATARILNKFLDIFARAMPDG